VAEDSRPSEIRTNLQAFRVPIPLPWIEVFHTPGAQLRIPQNPLFIVDTRKCIAIPISWLRAMPETPCLNLKKARVIKGAVAQLMRISIACISRKPRLQTTVQGKLDADLKDAAFRLLSKDSKSSFVILTPEVEMTWSPIFCSRNVNQPDNLKGHHNAQEREFNAIKGTLTRLQEWQEQAGGSLEGTMARFYEVGGHVQVSLGGTMARLHEVQEQVVESTAGSVAGTMARLQEAKEQVQNSICRTM
jgi:hypothetical protein